jgi:hypothetical protein
MLILYRAGGRCASNGLQKAFQPPQGIAPDDRRVSAAQLGTGSSIEHPPRQFE